MFYTICCHKFTLGDKGCYSKAIKGTVFHVLCILNAYSLILFYPDWLIHRGAEGEGKLQNKEQTNHKQTNH